MPWEYVRTARCTSSPRPAISSASSRWASSAGRPVAPQYSSQVLPAGQVRQEAGALDERADPGEHRRARADGVAEDRISPLVGRDQAHQHAQGRGLARAVRPEQAEHLALLDPEGQVADRAVPVRVPLARAPDRQRDPGQRRVGRSAAAPAREHDEAAHDQGRDDDESDGPRQQWRQALATQDRHGHHRDVDSAAPGQRDGVVPGAAGNAYAWSVVDTTSRSRWPAPTSRTTAGSETRTSTPSDGTPLSRIGVTSCSGRVAEPPGATSYSWANRVASGRRDRVRDRTCRLTPESRRSDRFRDGADSKTATWSGSAESPRLLPAPVAAVPLVPPPRRSRPRRR